MCILKRFSRFRQRRLASRRFHRFTEQNSETHDRLDESGAFDKRKRKRWNFLFSLAGKPTHVSLDYVLCQLWYDSSIARIHRRLSANWTGMINFIESNVAGDRFHVVKDHSINIQHKFSLWNFDFQRESSFKSPGDPSSIWPSVYWFFEEFYFLRGKCIKIITQLLPGICVWYMGVSALLINGVIVDIDIWW